MLHVPFGSTILREFHPVHICAPLARCKVLTLAPVVLALCGIACPAGLLDDAPGKHVEFHCGPTART
eukprot:9402725-Pyramimonas_sp.AAC.1